MNDKANTQQHTPTPWKQLALSDELITVSSEAGRPIAITATKKGRDEDIANAAFIVEACNGWDDADALRKRLAELEPDSKPLYARLGNEFTRLRASNRELVEALKMVLEETNAGLWDCLPVDKARAALANAQKGDVQ